MKDTKHKILTLAALTTIAAGVIHLTNRVIVASSQLKEMLDFSNPTKEVTDIRAIQLNSSFTQVTFFRFIADGFKNIFIHNKTSRIRSVNNYIYLFGGALAS